MTYPTFFTAAVLASTTATLSLVLAILFSDEGRVEELGSKAKAAHSFASVICPRFRFVDAILSSVTTSAPWVLAFGSLAPPFATVFPSSCTKDDTSVVPALDFVGRAALAVVEAADLAFG